MAEDIGFELRKPWCGRRAWTMISPEAEGNKDPCAVRKRHEKALGGDMALVSQRRDCLKRLITARTVSMFSGILYTRVRFDVLPG